MKLLFKSFLIIFSLLLFINSCSKDSPIPDAVVPTPNLIVTLSVTASEGGRVSTEGGTYDEGTEVTITASANEGYRFTGWEGNSSNDESLTVTLNSNITLNGILKKNIIMNTINLT